MSAGSVLGTFSLLANGIAGAVTFITFPATYGASWPWILQNVVRDYGPGMQEHSWWIWGAILAVILFAATRVALLFAVSAAGLLVALRAFFRDRRR